MTKQIGLWIDHRQAIIVHLSEQGDSIETLHSQIAKKVRFSGVSHNQAEAHDDFAEDKRERRFKEQLKVYFDEVISHIEEADSIIIIGPGEASHELAKRIEAKSLGSKIIAIEAADKLTEKQIAAKLAEMFKTLLHPS